MAAEQGDPRTARRSGRELGSRTGRATEPFRVDRDRIAGSPFFSRLSGVTQVVSPSGSGLVVHNRLTHSLKVAEVARVIAARLLDDPVGAAVVDKLGGCDLDVVEAAALAHDLGHPPFGHLGEEVLDRLARHRLGLPDGFEGNAQSFRILSTIDVLPDAVGLDLTAATRAAVLKYPWARRTHPQPHPSAFAVPPRGAAEPDGAAGTGSSKFSIYVTELDDYATARAPFAGRIAEWQQTVEAAVMDTADDLAYAIHDLQDFHRVGVLQHASVTEELTGWEHNAAELAMLSDRELAQRQRRAGYSLEALRRRLHSKDSWIVDDAAFRAAVIRVRHELVDSLLAVPFDGSIDTEQAVAAFAARWSDRLVDGITVCADPPTRSGHVQLAPEQWHEVQVLKFVHRRFVLLRPDLALHQRGQAQLLTALVEALEQWLGDPHETERLPRRLHDLVELSAAQYAELAASAPHLLAGGTGETPAGTDDLRRLARGRAVVDFVASLTDSQAAALLDALTGRASQLWTNDFVL